MTDPVQLVQGLWQESTAKMCRRSCHCPLPEHCRELLPVQVEQERQRRIAAGLVERTTHVNGLAIVDYVRKENEA